MAPCLLYTEKCDESSGIPLRTVFDMLDSLVGKIREYRPRSSSKRRGHLTPRIKMEFLDRLHDYIFPWLFQYPFVGTVQVIWYGTSELVRRQFGICGPPNPRPYACKHQWTRFSRTCHPTDKTCVNVGSVWLDVTRRYSMLEGTYPNRTIETVVIEKTNVNRPEGLTFLGRKYADIIVLTRVRDCTSTPCHTIAIDDYRYESVTITKNTKAWYVATALLRLTGQTYAWLRLASLLVACYVTRTSEAGQQNASFTKKITITLRTVFVVPSQVIVYDWTLPIACYTVAHLIDGRFGEEMLAAEYISLQGATNHTEIKRYLRINAVSMRSVWIAAPLCHIFLEIYTRRLWTSNRGIPGVSEFLLSIIVLPTVLAHVRFDTVRDARLLEIEEVITNTRRVAIQRVSYFTRFNFIGSLLIGGATIDIKCVFFGALVVTTISILVNGLRLLRPRWQQYKMATVSRTLVPCTAGSLWRPNALVVSWDGAIFIKQSADLRRLLLFTIRDSDGRVSSLSHGLPMRRPTYTTPRAAERKSTLKTSSQNGKRDIAMEIESNRDDAMIYLMNLAVMSDPVTLFRLRMLLHHTVGLYESRLSGRCFLLPYPLHNRKGDLPIDWGAPNLLKVVSTKDVQWWILLQCG